MIDSTVHLSYKDILLVPYDDDFCEIESRNYPDISTEICKGIKIDIPLISAPMDSVTGPNMAIALSKIGSLGILTRYIGQKDEQQTQVNDIKLVRESCPNAIIATAIGVKNDVWNIAKRLCDEGVNIICLDIANGNHIFMRDALREVSMLKQHYNISIIAGNVASGKSACRLAENGADAIKIGIGPGAACTTRRVVGFGCPQLHAIMDCSKSLKRAGFYQTKIIADGGCRFSGDVVKALWAGADVVMAGFIFAGHDECPSFNDEKLYRGMSSRTVSGRSDVAPEGVCMKVTSRGPVADTVLQYAAAIKSGLSMANAMNLDELRKNVRAIRVSTMSNEESDPIPAEYL